MGTVNVAPEVTARDWLVLLSQLLTLSASGEDATHHDVVEKLDAAGVLAFTLGPPPVTDDDSDFMRRAKEAAKRTYSHSVAVTRECMGSVRMGQAPNIKKIKRVVQTIVDQILNEETSLVGLTTIRDYDEYTFTHSVNVCIFSVALGRRLGLAKLQLFDLGLAALFHDIGKSRVPLGVLNKVENLTDEDWRWLAAHPWLGVLALFQVRGLQDTPYRAMVVAYEHHMKTDLTGYPRTVRPREQSIFSKIVAVADGFDAATSRRAYQTVPDVAGGGPRGHARQPAARFRPGHREGVHQPRRRLSGRHAGRARHVRAGDRALGQLESPGHFAPGRPHRERRSW